MLLCSSITYAASAIVTCNGQVFLLLFFFFEVLQHITISFERIWFPLLMCVCVCSSFCFGPQQSHTDIRAKDILEMEDQFRSGVSEHQMLYVLSKSCRLPGATLKARRFR